MRAPLPTYFLMVVFAGWLNRQQQAAIEYLKTENEILKSPLKGRLRLSDDDRRRLADPPKDVGSTEGKLRRRERLGGMLNYYYRDAA